MTYLFRQFRTVGITLVFLFACLVCAPATARPATVLADVEVVAIKPIAKPSLMESLLPYLGLGLLLIAISGSDS